jgi:hypothetical protein
MALKVRDYDKPSKKGKADDDRPSFSDRSTKLDLGSVPKRRSKAQLTSELIDTYCRILNQNTLEGAAQAIGFSPRTIADWVTKGQDPDCTDERLIELAEKQAYVMTNGNRKTMIEIGFEHMLDDPKMAMFMMERMMPGFNPPKTQKIDMAVSATKAPSEKEFEGMSDEEVAAMAHLERLKLKRLAGG